MNHNGLATGPEESSGRHWSFGDCEFDEISRQLRVQGRLVESESKPLDLLLQLLLHAGEVVTKEELLEAIWPDVMVVDGSLATAVSKLRRAIGEDEGHPLIVTIPRVGYRLAVPVHCRTIAAVSGPDLALKPGDCVPGRSMWRLERSLDASGSGEVWLGRNPRTSEERVFKFAVDGLRLKALKREITVSRFLRESLGERPEFVRILEWNLTTPPFFLESEYAGPNLVEWADSQGGLARCPLATRLQLLIEIAHTVAAAHSVGVLHKDLKPANILVQVRPGGGWQIRIADFGSASLFDPARLRVLGITNLGFTHTVSPERQPITGTLMYMAPEILAGHSPSIGSDVYALGVMLYQFVIGDLRRPLAPGWENDIHDPLLPEDIAAAACGDPARRLGSAGELVDRLRSLEQRRLRRSELESAQIRARIAEQRLARTRARRPWILAAAAALILGLGFSLALYHRAVAARDRAAHETQIADAINTFLTDDLLGRSNPFASGKTSESFIDAITQASPGIDRMFRNEPLIAARLHQAIARALDARTDYGDARVEYERSAALFRQAQGPVSQDAMVVEFQRATLEARSYEKDTLPLARSIVQQQDALMATLRQPRPDLAVWDASARGMVALITNDAPGATADFRKAVDLAGALPEFDPTARLTFQQRLAFCYVRLGDGRQAEKLFRHLIAAFTAAAGPDSANVLRVRLNLAQAYMIEKKYAEAIHETSAIYPLFVARLGPDHELTLQLLATRAESEGSLGLWNDAVRDDLTVYRLAVQKQGLSSFFAIATLSDAALAQCRGGDFLQGSVNAQRAYDVSARAFGAQAGLTGGAAYTVASCLIGLGRLQKASLFLKQIDVPVVVQLTGDPDFGADVTLANAQIASREGDQRTARSAMDQVRAVFTRADAEPFQKRAFDTLRAALDAPQTPPAGQRLPAATPR